MIGAPTLILCYHRVAEHVHDPFRLCVSPENFAAHLSLLDHRADLITLDEVCRPSRSPRVVVTFDDGYADNLHNAAPIAERLGAPITVYVASGMVGDRRGFWWDRLAELVRFVPGGRSSVSVEIGPRAVDVRWDDEQSALQARDQLHGQLRARPTGEISQALEVLSEQLERGSSAPEDARPLEHAELRSLAASDVVAIGAHTVDHALLRAQPAEEQWRTMHTSKVDLEAELGQDVEHFAYPFGGHDSFDTTTVSAARHCGFSTATTTVPGSVGRTPDPHALRRRLVMDWGPARFRAQMVRWGML